MDTTSTLIFIIAAFSLALVLILTRDSIPQPMRRGVAIIALVLVVFAFFLIVYSFWTAGDPSAGAAGAAAAGPYVRA